MKSFWWTLIWNQLMPKNDCSVCSSCNDIHMLLVDSIWFDLFICSLSFHRKNVFQTKDFMEGRFSQRLLQINQKKEQWQIMKKKSHTYARKMSEREKETGILFWITTTTLKCNFDSNTQNISTINYHLLENGNIKQIHKKNKRRTEIKFTRYFDEWIASTAKCEIFLLQLHNDKGRCSDPSNSTTQMTFHLNKKNVLSTIDWTSGDFCGQNFNYVLTHTIKNEQPTKQTKQQHIPNCVRKNLWSF